MASTSVPPRVWVLAGPRAGDRSQLLALAEALGWPYEVKDLACNALHHLPNWLLGASLVTLDRASATALTPPWPDLIIDGGKRSVPVARWVRARTAGARWVHVGRPWAPLAAFDLLLAAPQYRLPPRANVLLLDAPLHKVTPASLAAAAAAWSPRLQHLPRPWHAVLVGGSSPPYRLDAAVARRLAAAADAHARATGGSLLVTTSARTPPDAAAALFAALTTPSYPHRWEASAPDNPYLAFLALADDIIVTGDSASMLTEACATGKPVALFEVPRRPSPLRRLLGALDRASARRCTRLVERGLFMPLRDLGEVHRRLAERGLLHRLGDEPPSRRSPPLDVMSPAVARIRALFTAADDEAERRYGVPSPLAGEGQSLPRT